MQQLKQTEHIFHLIYDLLNRQELVETLTMRQENKDKQALVELLTVKQYQGEIQQLLNRLHPYDIANLLEQLPPVQRSFIWQLLQSEHMGAVLLELSDSLRQTLLAELQPTDLIRAASHLDTDEIADLMQELPDEIGDSVLSSLPQQQRENVQSTLLFPEESVGAWMEYDFAVVLEHQTLDQVLRELRQKGKLPDESGFIMVINSAGLFQGLLLVSDLLIKRGDLRVADCMLKQAHIFHTTDSADEAARDFERYELLVAPVVNAHQKLVGVLRVSSLMDLLEEQSQRQFLAQAGLSKEENLFDPMMKSAKNRWPWIALNLVIVLIASRVIDQFQTTISSMVALAALLPITANIGGNTGNQVVALVIRGLALKQLDANNLRRLYIKEFSVAAVNGLIWGSLTGLLTLFLYQNLGLAFVMMLAMSGTMVLAALIGVSIPLILKKLKQDPVLGSSIITTGMTDTLGFLIFLSLASLLLPN